MLIEKFTYDDDSTVILTPALLDLRAKIQPDRDAWQDFLHAWPDRLPGVDTDKRSDLDVARGCSITGTTPSR